MLYVHIHPLNYKLVFFPLNNMLFFDKSHMHSPNNPKHLLDIKAVLWEIKYVDKVPKAKTRPIHVISIQTVMKKPRGKRTPALLLRKRISPVCPLMIPCYVKSETPTWKAWNPTIGGTETHTRLEPYWVPHHTWWPKWVLALNRLKTTKWVYGNRVGSFHCKRISCQSEKNRLQWWKHLTRCHFLCAKSIQPKVSNKKLYFIIIFNALSCTVMVQAVEIFTIGGIINLKRIFQVLDHAYILTAQIAANSLPCFTLTMARCIQTTPAF